MSASALDHLDTFPVAIPVVVSLAAVLGTFLVGTGLPPLAAALVPLVALVLLVVFARRSRQGTTFIVGPDRARV
ncbi:hypothetical protein [Halorientalis pallida]|uniref:Uncharacterized protein n=1 Tax=Halorientalis pallida TaxID=2479928 RepID=A0A498L079_9EURY|nr:hypothetical protein [Halorientalis pallida]RXK51688.1 hypothetical protein EAF64_03385 [Halorientalis pallida]